MSMFVDTSDYPKPEFETMNPKREVLIAWLEEASKPGAVTNKAIRRLCFEAALMLRKEVPPTQEKTNADD